MIRRPLRRHFPRAALGFLLFPGMAFGFSLTDRPAGESAFHWTPYFSAELYGGQSTFSGDSQSPVSGPNGSLLFVPGFRLGPRLTILPSFSVNYRQTRDVQELIGGGFLTQKQSDQSAAVKALWALTDRWKFKGYGSFKQELVQESTDEKWGQGLFDYQKTAAGLELERSGMTVRSFRAGVDLYWVAFPNFDSLSADAQQFGGEVNAGTHVLDYRSLDGTLSTDVLLSPRTAVSATLAASDRRFGDQNLVQVDGTYAGTLRHDLFLFSSAALRRQGPSREFRWATVDSVAGLDLSAAWLNSNQNNYDTSRTVFNNDYYDYVEWTAGPRVSLRFNQKLSVGLGAAWSRRRYGRRPVQDADGTYLSGNVTTTAWTYRVSLGYPLMEHLDAVLTGAYQDASSNMKYESVYRYNYSSASYFGGLSLKI